MAKKSRSVGINWGVLGVVIGLCALIAALCTIVVVKNERDYQRMVNEAMRQESLFNDVVASEDNEWLMLPMARLRFPYSERVVSGIGRQLKYRSLGWCDSEAEEQCFMIDLSYLTAPQWWFEEEHLSPVMVINWDGYEEYELGDEVRLDVNEVEGFWTLKAIVDDGDETYYVLANNDSHYSLHGVFQYDYLVEALTGLQAY